MSKYSFNYDYAEGMHPDILKALQETNLVQQLGYGEDEYISEAVEVIKDELGRDDVDVHFVCGGTLANLTIISSSLRSYESVIAASTAHIAGHETGAIEYTGHKIHTIDTPDGKLNPGLIQKVLDEHIDEHMVVPKLVYISNSTEMGTIYTKEDLTELSKYCKENNLILFLDGARLAMALTSRNNKDLTIKDIAKLTDVFYIGGTKNGAILGEAIVLVNDNLKENFRHYMKQRGALLAKGRLFGVQFHTLFKTGLFYDLAKHANNMAYKLADGIKQHGYDFLAPVQTNIILPVFPNKLIDFLQQEFMFSTWSKIDSGYTSIRLVTSWATKPEKVDEFIHLLNKYKH